MTELARTQPQLLEDDGLLQPCGCVGYTVLPEHLRPPGNRDFIYLNEDTRLTLTYIYNKDCRENFHPCDLFVRIVVPLLPPEPQIDLPVSAIAA